MNLNKDILIGFGVGLFTGGGAGVLIATKHAEARANAEIQSVKEEFRALMAQTTKRVDEMDKVIEKAGERGFIYEEDTCSSEERVSDDQLEELRQKLTAGPPIGDALPSTGSHTVQADFTTEETKARIYADQEKIDLDGDDPYVITVDQFQDEHVTGPNEHDKQTITYFAGDGVLVDSRDMIIKDTQKTVGEFADRFGHGSDEEHIVYVRNCWMTVDFEIVREEGTYASYISRSDDWENEDIKPPVLRMRRD